VENVIRMHGTGHKGRLTPVVSSLFSIKAAHCGNAIEIAMDGEGFWFKDQRSESREQRPEISEETSNIER
jgi:hypothetical protein